MHLFMIYHFICDADDIQPFASKQNKNLIFHKIIKEHTLYTKFYLPSTVLNRNTLIKASFDSNMNKLCARMGH